MRFRLSDNRSWATTFVANDEIEFRVEFAAALGRSAGRLVSLHKIDPAWSHNLWLSVGHRQMGVFADMRSEPERMPRCEAGRYERRGHGLEYLSVGVDDPCADVVWDEAHDRAPRRTLPVVECRAVEVLSQQDEAAGRTITHAAMQRASGNVLMRVQGSATDWPTLIQAFRDYVDLARAFVGQGGTRGNVRGAGDHLLRRIRARVHVHSPASRSGLREIEAMVSD